MTVAMQEQESLFPTAKPKTSVLGLKHTQGTIVVGITEGNGFKAVLLTVQLLNGGLSPFGNSPDLVVVVDEHLGYRLPRILDVILPDLTGIRHIPPYTLCHGRYP